MKHVALALMLATPAVAQENPIDRIRPDAPELAPYGEHTVGVRTMTFTRPDVVDVVNSTEEGNMTRYDREITVEVFYPAAEGTEAGGTYTAYLRDGETQATLTGRAARDAAPAEGSFPLVLISHGYPGNRFLMAHLAENLASKGYVTASIDHPDSTYSDIGAFGSTLYNRPQDQSFVLDQMASLGGDLGGIVDASRTGLVGYSMGGYGALIFSGAGLEEGGWPERYTPPGNLLSELRVGADRLAEIHDDRLAATVAIGPWGRNRGFWSQEGLSNIDVPLMIVAGSQDDVSGYDAIRTIFDETTGTTRHLLTYQGANHNAAAPMPAPQEAWGDPAVFGHYADAVWDTTRMNNILQHFVTAFMDLHLKDDQSKAEYLDLVETADDGTYAMEDGQPTEDHTYWKGFPERSAKALRFETKEPQ
ncbi:alpha/beta hydrolase family protein [Palleronia sp.]|uniref:alpha/beta hydrolase family protein n=1 Tax=Palleronia sp. TaxID=1940284 RepID=UPI0035C7F44E